MIVDVNISVKTQLKDKILDLDKNSMTRNCTFTLKDI